MKYPFHRYIDFLVTNKFSYEEIGKILKGHGLLCPSEEYIDEREEKLIEKCPLPKFKTYMTSKRSTFKKKVKDFLTCMDVLEVKDLWLSESNFKHDKSMAPMMRAVNIFNIPAQRRSLECFLLNKLPIEEMVQCFNSRYKVQLTQGAIDNFKKYYFDSSRMDRSDWIKYLKACPRDKMILYVKAMNIDSNRLRHTLGFKTKLEYSDMLSDIMSTSYYKFRDGVETDLDENDPNSRSWAKMAIEAGEKKEKVQAGNMEDFAETLQLQMTFSEEEFPTFEEVLTDEN